MVILFLMCKLFSFIWFIVVWSYLGSVSYVVFVVIDYVLKEI